MNIYCSAILAFSLAGVPLLLSASAAQAQNGDSQCNLHANNCDQGAVRTLPPTSGGDNTRGVISMTPGFAFRAAPQDGAGNDVSTAL